MGKFEDMFSKINALNPCNAIIIPGLPPTLDSLIPLVRGLLPHTDVRAEFGKGLPVRIPFEMISLFLSPKGSQVGGTSSRRIWEPNPLAPKRKYFELDVISSY